MKATEILSANISDKKKIELLTGSKSVDFNVWKEYYEGNQLILARIHPTDIAKTSKINKIVFNLYKKIIDTSVTFLFGNDPELILNNPNEKNKILFEEFKVSYRNAKTGTINQQIGKETFAYTESAEILFWKNGNVKYQFLSSEKEELYPHFDEKGDMDAFVRIYKVDELINYVKKEVTYVEVYLETQMIKFKKVGTGYEKIMIEVEGSTADEKKEIEALYTYKKIPIVYYSIDEPLPWHVKTLLDRFNLMASTLGDVNDYFAYPILKLLGEPVEDTTTGQTELQRNTPQVLHLKRNEEVNSDAEYLDWNSKPESAIYELQNLFRFIYLLTSTPDLSFENLKGLSNISGIALKLMFIDAVSQSQALSNIFFKLSRRINIHKSILTEMTGKDYNSLDITVDFKSPIPENIQEIIQSLSTSVSSGIMSVETAVENNPFVMDSVEEMTKIESMEAGSFNIPLDDEKK